MVQTATAEEVKRSIEQDTAAVVNVLAAEDHREEHIPGTMNIPYEEGIAGWKERGHEVTSAN